MNVQYVHGESYVPSCSSASMKPIFRRIQAFVSTVLEVTDRNLIVISTQIFTWGSTHDGVTDIQCYDTDQMIHIPAMYKGFYTGVVFT